MNKKNKTKPLQQRADVEILYDRPLLDNIKTYNRPLFNNPTITYPTRLSKLGDPFRGDLVILPPNYPVFNPDVNPNKDLRNGVFANKEQNKEKLANINRIMSNYR